MTTHTDDFEGGDLGPEWKQLKGSERDIGAPQMKFCPQWVLALLQRAGDTVRWECSGGHPDRYWINGVEVFEPPHADEGKQV